MRMAKMQKATLDPSKISGYCGRLKCCLRYEDKTYTELKKNLPKKNAKVKTKYGQGTVVDTNILTQLVVIEHDDGTKIAVPVEELELISSKITEKEIQDSTSDDENQDDSEIKNQ
jgi:cell fate regulator YaaT (PSP1 superfamily)